MSLPEESSPNTASHTRGAAMPAVAILTIALYALAMAAAAILLLVGLAVVTGSTGWEAGSRSAATTAVVGGLALGFALLRRPAGIVSVPGLLLVASAAATGMAALLAALVVPAGRALHRAIWPLSGGTGLGDWCVDFGFAAAVLLLPALCYAAMPEALSRLLGSDRPVVVGGYTLGVSSAGLALGAALGGGFLLPVLGLKGTLLLGVALLGLAAGGMTLIGRSGVQDTGSLGRYLAGHRPPQPASPTRPQPTSHPVDNPDDGAGGLPGTLTALLIGLYGWGMWICWSRVVGLIAGPTGPSGAIAMAVLLFGVGLGAFGVTALSVRRPAVALSIALLAAGVVVAATSFYVTPAARLYLDLIASATSVGLFSFPGALITLVIVLPSALALGAILALLAGLGRAASTPVSIATSRWAGAILLGAVAGDALFRLALVPGYGLRRSLSIASAMALLAAIIVLRSVRSTPPAARTSGTLTLAGLLLLVAAFPAPWDPQVIASASYRYGARGVERLGSVQSYLEARHTTTPVFYREGRNATVMAERRLQADAGGEAIEALQLTLDGRVVADNLADMRTQILAAHLPLLLHGEARTVLLAGFSTGVTAGSILTHPIESLLVVEEEPALFGVEPLFGAYNNNPLADPRLSRAAASPRAWLRTDREQYDVILCRAPAPWLPSDAALLSLQGYEEMKARLRPGGLVAQRIALSTVDAIGVGSILRTFAAAFDEVLLFQISPEDLLLIGASVPLRLDNGRLRDQIATQEAVLGDLSRALNVGVDELLMALRLDGGRLRDLVGSGPVNRDDHSTAALEALRDMRIHDNGILVGAINDAGRDSLLEVLVNYGEGTEAEAPFLYGLAKSYLGLAADPEHAEAIADHLLNLGEISMAAWVRGEASRQQGDYDAAMHAWEGILETEPDFLDALFSLGVLYLDRRDYFAADRYLAPAARLHPDASIVIYHYGRNLFYLERYEEALQTLQRARATAGSPHRYPLIDYLAGVSALRLKRADEAERDLKAYLEWAYAQQNLTVLEVEAHSRLAEVYDLQGEPVKARGEREKGLELQIKMREFASRQSDSLGSTGQRGLTLPNPGSDRSGGTPPAEDPASTPESAVQPHDP